MSEAPSPQENSSRSLFRADIAVRLGLTLLPFVMVLLRVARVSRFEPQTASAVVARSGVVEVVVGTLLPLVPFLLAVGIVAYAFLSTDFGVDEASPQGHALETLLLIVAMGWLLVLPWIFSAFAVGFSVMIILLEMTLGRRREGPREHRIARSLACGLAAALAISVVLSDDMWLPRERIEMSRGEQLVGYVLSSESGWIAVLEHESRQIHMISRGEVQGRVLCGSRGDLRSVVELVTRHDGPSYPPCATGD